MVDIHIQLPYNNSMNTQTFSVAGNLDQIKRDCVLVKLRWTTVNPKQPNRVKHVCNDIDLAKALYNALQCRKMTAMKDWI
jgi:hypothetical protein